jgi:hypothetical protein
VSLRIRLHDRRSSRSTTTNRRGRAVAALAAPVAVAALALTSCQGATPGNDTFYTGAITLTGTSPGQILRSRTSTFTLDPVARTQVIGTKSWQIVYRSNNARGVADAVSGTVIVPTTPWLGLGKRPIVGVTVGTRGLGDHCAPSYTLSQGTDYEGAFIAGLVANGFAVMVTDYEGLGMPGNHTYVVGQSEGRAVLDGVRAAQRLSGTGLSTSNPVGLMGYSQGGGGAAWGAQLAASYAPELNIKGVVAGGVPADLGEVAKFEDGGPVVSFTLMAAMGLDSAYPELKLQNYLNAKGKKLISESNQTCLATADGVQTIFTTAFKKRADYTSSDPLATAAWKARINENKLGAVAPKAPVYQFHGVVDEMVPYQQAATLRRTWCNKGANVYWTPVVGEHLSTMVTEYKNGVTWLQSRFNGVPAVSNCLLP